MINPAEVLGRPLDPRHEVLELRIEAPYLFGKLEPAHVPAVRAWAQGQGLEPLLTVLEPQLGWITKQHLLHAAPQGGAAVVTEVLLGEEVAVLDPVLDTVIEAALEPRNIPQHTWVRVRTQRDAYLGWLPQSFVTSSPYNSTHVVTALRAHAYAGPQVQASPIATLAWGSRVALVQVDGAWAQVSLPDGSDAFVRRTLLHPLDEVPAQSVLASWEPFLGAPYLWGGCSAWGLDCSGFVQLLFRMAGRQLPRDADEQRKQGAPVSPEAARPGDLVAFEGHIGLYLGEGRMVHANAANMAVTVDDRAQPHLESIFLGFVRYTP